MKSVLFLLQILLLSSPSFAQEITISGTVKDMKGEPVPFASVKVKELMKVLKQILAVFTTLQLLMLLISA